jgi:hypothetical protein
LGKAHVTSDRIAHLRRTLAADKRQTLIRDIKFAPAWMHSILRTLAED